MVLKWTRPTVYSQTTDTHTHLGVDVSSRWTNAGTWASCRHKPRPPGCILDLQARQNKSGWETHTDLSTVNLRYPHLDPVFSIHAALNFSGCNYKVFVRLYIMKPGFFSWVSCVGWAVLSYLFMQHFDSFTSCCFLALHLTSNLKSVVFLKPAANREPDGEHQDGYSLKLGTANERGKVSPCFCVVVF